MRYECKNNEEFVVQRGSQEVDVFGLKSAMQYDFNMQLSPSVTLRPITDATDPDANVSRVDIPLPESMTEKWMLVSLTKYECYSGSTRVDAVVIFQFTRDGQTTVRVGLKTTGQDSKTIDSIRGSLLLIER